MFWTNFQQGRAGINRGPVQDFKGRPNRLVKQNNSRNIIGFERVSHNGVIGNWQDLSATEQASRSSAFWRGCASSVRQLNLGWPVRNKIEAGLRATPAIYSL